MEVAIGRLHYLELERVDVGDGMLPQGHLLAEGYRVPFLVLDRGLPHPIHLQQQILLSLVDCLELYWRF